MAGLSGIQMAFQNQTIWHPTFFDHSNTRQQFGIQIPTVKNALFGANLLANLHLRQVLTFFRFYNVYDVAGHHGGGVGARGQCWRRSGITF